MRVEVVDGIETFEALRAEWDEAAAASADTDVFMTWDWLRACWRHSGERRSDAQLHVVLVRDDEGLVAAAPLSRMREGSSLARATVLQPVSHDAGSYGSIVLTRRHDEAVDVLIGHLAVQLRDGVDAVVLTRLCSDSVFLARLRQRAATAADVACDFTPLPGACLFTDVSNGYDMRQHLKRHRIRSRLRRLNEAHEVVFDSHSGPTLGAGMEQLLEVHRRRWDGRDDGPTFVTDPDKEAFLVDSVRTLDAAGRVRLLTLTADGRTVAAELGLEFAGRVHMFRGAFDPEFAAFGPGHLMMYRVFEDGIGRGIREFDFLRGEHPYKRRWTNGERHLVTATITRSGWSGKLAGQRLRAARKLSR